jgi:Arc/MetJ family transcription regulator
MPVVTKRLVEIDDELLARAKAVTGEPTIRATVEAALRQVVDRDRAVQYVRELSSIEYDLDALDVAREIDFPIQDDD